MKKTIIISIFYLLIMNLNAQQLTFSDSTAISILTCSPGKEVYAKFGHTGIRLNDPVNKIDVVFNYGLFSFNTDNFYYKFIKGETDYLLGVQQTSLFLPEYKERNSIVWEQVLNLTAAEKQKIINSLLVNFQLENRTYRYNFVFDNCATRPRDKIFNGISGYVKLQSASESRTFRQWIGVYVGTDTWLKFGIDIVFGMDADDYTKQNESMFLPEMLMNEFQMAEIITYNHQISRKLVLQKNLLVNSDLEFENEIKFFKTPLFFFLIIMFLGIALSYYELKKNKYFTSFDSILLFVSGLAGIVVAYLMFVSVHPLVKSNLNILWLNPLNVIIAVAIWYKPLRMPIFLIQLANIAMLGLALVALALSAQSFNVAAFPLIVLMLVRYSGWVVRTKHKLFRKSKFLIKNKISDK